jgi:lytic murein transglycosylase
MVRALGGLVLAMLATGARAEAPAVPGSGDSGAALMQEAGSQAGFEAWVARFRPRALAAGISPATFDAAFAGAAYDPKVIERDRNQNEFTKTIWDYLDTAVSGERVANGRTALAANRAVLARIEAEYGVEAEILVAIWGLESAYGGYRGTTPVIGALASLAYDGRRAAFFEGELLAALSILQAGETDPDAMRGSWAGAMGHTQFMPSSYLAHAVDFTGDGRRDIWGEDPADALASSAAYLAGFGWQRGMPWGLEVTLPAGFDHGETGERVRKPVAEWRALGVTTAEGAPLPDHGPAAVLLPGGWTGAAFLVFANFQVIERYNSADAYVIAVGHLADRIAGGPPIRAAWPRGDRALTLPERIALQERLTAAGFDTKGVDGRIGPNTIAAIRGFQRSLGLVADGYANPALLDRLR